MKKFIYITLFFLVVGVILYFSIVEVKKTKIHYDNTKDVTLNVKIDNNNLGVTFYGGNLIKENLTYGNKIEKIIKIENNENNIAVVAIAAKDTKLSNEYLTYNLSYSEKKDGEYKELTKNVALKNDMNIGYNLGIEKDKTIYFKLEVISNYEKEESSVEFKLDIVNNLTNKELFMVDAENIIKELKEKIDALNGITEAGYYTYKVDQKLKGIILIDASDISDLKFVLNLYNDSLMIKGIKYHEVNKNKVISIDKSFTKGLNSEQACKMYTKRKCLDFSEIKFNSKGGKDVFYNDLKKVLNSVKNIHQSKNKNIIYDVSKDITNDTSVSGYVLVSEKNEYYLYLKNDLYMVAGYNISKYGDFNADSVTVRAYNKTAYDLCAKDKKQVCSFSGLKNCVDKNGNNI